MDISSQALASCQRGTGGVGMTEELLIDQAFSGGGLHYESFGWHHWRKYPRVSCQYRRTLRGVHTRLAEHVAEGLN